MGSSTRKQAEASAAPTLTSSFKLSKPVRVGSKATPGKSDNGSSSAAGVAQAQAESASLPAPDASPLRRSARSRSSGPQSAAEAFAAVASASSPRKRQRIDPAPASTPPASPSKAGRSPKKGAAAEEEELPPLLDPSEVAAYTTVSRPSLPFSLPAAIAHLRAADARFDKLFALVPLRPFLELARGEVRELDLFKTLCTSILGQQISWLAARSVLYKFCRMFVLRACRARAPSPAAAEQDAERAMPAAPDYERFPREAWPFPAPHDVLAASDEELRGAGLSGQKVKYIRDIARRFADGRLDARRLVDMDEEQIVEELVKIKGVGVWTAEMTLMFALRKPNVLPVGDLGVQRGMMLFYLADMPQPDASGHLLRGGVHVSERKKATKDEKKKPAAAPAGPEESEQEDGVTASQAQAVEAEEVVEKAAHDVGEVHDASAPPPSPSLGGLLDDETTTPPLPRTLQPLPPEAGLTPATLRARKDGKKVKGAYLTPDEMRALAKPWEPYRSIASFFMYALVDGVDSE